MTQTRPFLLGGLAALLLALGGGGCARYEYDVVEPSELAQHVPADKPVSFTRDPLRYRLVTVDGHLVMRVYNDTREPITLLGADSYVVDPRGQSHPLQSQTIAPGSYVRVILPPVSPRLAPRGPTIGIGIGAGFGRGHWHHRHHHHFHDAWYGHGWYGEPRYYSVYDPSNNLYWEWGGNGTTANLVLVYHRGARGAPATAPAAGDGANLVRHEFVFRRVRM
jgi:hypothetical protein